MIKGIEPTLSEAGAIRIGCKGEERTSKKTGRVFRLPVKLDHFLITTNKRNKKGDFILDAELMSKLHSELKTDKITEIPIVLHSDKIDDVFPTSYAMYSGRKLTCRGDGEKACSWEIGQDGRRTGRKKDGITCPCPYLEKTKGDKICKPNGILHCSIALKGYAVAGAVHKWRTASIISIQRIIGSLKQIKSVCGTLRGIPLLLKLEQVAVAPVGAPDSTVYCCHIELRARDLLAVQKEALQLASLRAALGGHDASYGAMISAPAGDNESAEEVADVQEEFYPEILEDEEYPGVTEGLKKFGNNDRDLWGFSEAEYEDSSSTANGTPPPPKSESPEKRKEEPLQSEKVA